MKPLLLFVFLLKAMLSFTQDTTYINELYEPVLQKAEARFYRIDMPDSTAKVDFIRKIYRLNHQIVVEQPYIFEEENSEEPHIHGTEITWYETGELRSKRDYYNGNPYYTGKHEMYWKNGQLKRLDIFENSQIVKGSCYDQEGKEVSYFPFEIQPMPSGGKVGLSQFLSKNIKSPKKFSGQPLKVVARFVVNIDGSISDIEIIEKADHTGIEDEIVAFKKNILKTLEKMPKWTPAIRDGEIVRVRCNLPFSVEL